MATVPIRISGKEYHIACDDGQEEHLLRLALELDERVGQLNYQMGGHPGEVMCLLLASLMMVDEVAENKKEIERLSKEVRQVTQALGQQQKASRSPAEHADIENAMALTMNEIAARIEKIADQVEIR